MSGDVLFEPNWRPGVGRITINRPDRGNALTAELARRLIDYIQDAEDTYDTGCLVVGGSNGMFCAGADLDELAHDDPGVALRLINMWTKVVVAIRTSMLPIVAVVDGPCVGGGYHVSMAADYTIATPNAWFRHTGVDAGISPMMPGTTLLPSVVGLKRASSMILRPRKVPAQEALDMGLCSEICGEAELEQVVSERAVEFAGRDRIVIALGKAQINCTLGETLGSAVLSQMAGFLHSITPIGHAKLREYRGKITGR